MKAPIHENGATIQGALAKELHKKPLGSVQEFNDVNTVLRDLLDNYQNISCQGLRLNLQRTYTNWQRDHVRKSLQEEDRSSRLSQCRCIMHVYIHIYIHIYICICACMYIYIYI